MAKILVAVADRDACELYILALRFAGHHLFGASNLDEVTDRVTHTHPDLTVLDARLLEMKENDFQLLIPCEIMNLSSPVILLLEREYNPGRLEKARSWVGDFLYTPISLDQFTRQVNNVLKRIGK